ncbi:redoxin domain-containing protein [Prevotella corporis]|uniref:redoxin domain-containing protein n=1 Tax=Prevotella corporis TaxID=28128 RepID=UPI0023F6DAAC|nr:redoxin domain-containing protein [Prevotella corporis]
MKRILLSALFIFAAIAIMRAQDADAQYAKELLKPGTMAPDFTLLTADGKEIKLNTYRGNYVVLHFWASWCPDCRKEIPDVKKLWNDFRDYNVRFIGISFDINKQSWVKTYWDKYQMNWTQVSELKKWKKETNIDRLYKVDWIPTLYLIDPNGRVMLGTVQIEKLHAVLEGLKNKLNTSNPDVAPQYVGGDSAMQAYFMENELYTMKARKWRVEANVLVSLNIEIDGSTSGARALEVNGLKATNPKFEKLTPEEQQAILIDAETFFKSEAVRLVQRMSNWKPAEKNGRPVMEKITLTVPFDPYQKAGKKKA